MPISPLETAGAQIQPTSAAPLHTNEFFTGLWTHGNPLGPGAVPYLYQRFYSAARYDRFIAGLNLEISTQLTPIRRPGSSVYNPGPFPAINRFFEFRGFSATDEVIHLMADCAAPTNQLINPNFDSGATGWTLQAGWSMGTGSPFNGGNLAVYTDAGGGSGMVYQSIAVVPGEVITANCEGIGEPGATGTAVLRIAYYNASNTLLTSTDSAPIANNYIWALATVTATAPATTAYADVGFAVYGSTGGAPRWGCCAFYAGLGAAGSGGTVREVTQPSTNAILWVKQPTAGRTSFVSDGNILYAGDGVNTHKWVRSAASWQPTTKYNPGDFIVDPNGNLQMAVGSVTANIVNIQVDAVTLGGGTYGRQVTLFFSSATPFEVPNNISITTAGLTTVPAANETTPATLIVSSLLQCHWIEGTTTIPVTPFSVETGTATTGTGVSGGSAPAWNTTAGLSTQDGGNQWINMGPAVQSWGGAAPASPPMVTQAAAATLYPAWAANTFYAPLFVIFDSNSNLQQLTGPTSGSIKTGNNAPVWATTPGAITTETGGGGSNAQWTCKGPGTWVASATHAKGDMIMATYTYYVNSTYFDHSVMRWITITTAITTTSLFTCTVVGVSGATTPAWNNGILTTTQDGSVTWQNGGSAPGWPGGNQLLSLATTILDSLGNAQIVQNMGESGGTVPTWQSAQGATTTDNQIRWLNNGPYSVANTGAWIWAYSGYNTVTKEITNPSPLSQPLIVSAGMHPVIQGQGLVNPPWDTIILWRTYQGGSTLLYEDQFPNPGAGVVWTYTDTNPDNSPIMPNTQFPAPIPGLNGNDPPPQDFVPKCYYLGRIWGFENNKLRWTGGPDTVSGAGNSTMPAKNEFTFTASGVLCWPTSVGLIIFTTSDIWAVLGQGTDASPFYVIQFQQGIGMASQDAFTVNGSTAYAMISSHQVMSIDPGAGEVEVGFPLGNLFDDDYNPSLTYLAWHQGRSKDSALYVADGSQGWYRMAAVAAPESGNVWSPQAIIASPGKLKAIASIEINPGNRILVMGPSVDGNPILMRDTTTNADAGVSYAAYGVVSSVVLAQPGGTAGLQFVVTEEKMIAGATPIVCKILFDEILFGSPDITLADFRQLRNVTPDPPNLPAQKSVRTQRHWAAQDANTVIKCRHYQQQLLWAAENYPNELYTNTIYGRLPEKARK